MADENEKNTANQNSEGGAQESANQKAEGSAQQKTGSEESSGAGENKEVEGLKSAVVAEQKKRQEAETRAQYYEQLALQANQQQSQQQEQIDPEGFVQFKHIQQQNAQMMQSFQLQQIRTNKTDLDDVIGPNAGQQNYQPSEQVRKFMQDNPAYLGIDRFIAAGNPQAISVTYDLIKKQQKIDEQEALIAAAKEHSETVNSDNKTNPMSPAAAGGGGGTNLDSQVPPANTVEFDALWEDIKAGKFDQQRS